MPPFEKSPGPGRKPCRSDVPPRPCLRSCRARSPGARRGAGHLRRQDRDDLRRLRAGRRLRPLRAACSPAISASTCRAIPRSSSPTCRAPPRSAPPTTSPMSRPRTAPRSASWRSRSREEQLLGVAGVSYDVAKLAWIGRIASNVEVAYVWHAAPVKTIDDLEATEATFAGTGPILIDLSAAPQRDRRHEVEGDRRLQHDQRPPTSPCSAARSTARRARSTRSRPRSATGSTTG